MSLPLPLSITTRLLTVCLLVAGPVAAQSAPGAATGSFLPQPLIDWFAGINPLPYAAGCIAIAAIVLLVAHRLRQRRRDMRLAILGLQNGPRFRVVDAMVHCVWHARRIDKERLKRALELARNTTNMDYSIEHMREAAERADRIIIPNNFSYMAEGLTHAEKMVVFNSSVSVMLADGPLTMSDRKMLRTISRGLKLRHEDLSYLGRLIPE